MILLDLDCADDGRSYNLSSCANSMIYLSSIELTSFKGIDSLRCDFDDLTALVGINNSGKTSVLQAAYLLISVLPEVVIRSHVGAEHIEQRALNLKDPIAELGLPEYDWLLPSAHAPFRIRGEFWNGCAVTIRMHQRGLFGFDLEVASGKEPRPEVSPEIKDLEKVTATIFRPPGMLPARENMLSGNDYRSRVADGTGDTYWRNGIWWCIQIDGVETFQPVVDLVREHFPGIQILQPTLGDSANPAPILIRYRESASQHEHLDIAQSGAGLHTFLALAQIIRQSKANVILLDEPDSHLHASQQDAIVQLLSDVSIQEDRQVILATHSPEIISRVPDDCIRWLERGNPKAEGAEQAELWDRLGASADAYLSKSDFPKTIVYVEGKADRPIIERLIRWCRKTYRELPTTAVVRHNDGRFKEATLQGISRTASEVGLSTRVVGIRDLDWIYDDCEKLLEHAPNDAPDLKKGSGYVMVTLPCKELENLMCNAELLFDAIPGEVPTKEWLQQVIDEESAHEKIVEDWKYQAIHQIRARFGSGVDAATCERRADEVFSSWSDDPTVRVRLLSGKRLLGRIRKRIKDEHRTQLSALRIMDQMTSLPPVWAAMAEAIFPSIKES